MGLDWDDLRTFLMIARHHTLSGAARALGVQQPTMGRRLDALEQRAGARLLQKTPAGYVLTEAGKAVLAHVERIEEEAQAVERRIAGLDTRLEGAIRLTTVHTLATEILSPILAVFRQDHPAVRVTLVASTRSLNLTRREADVALRFAPFTQHGLASRRVGLIGFGLYAAPAYLARLEAGEAPSLIVTEDELIGTPEMRWLQDAFPGAASSMITNSRSVQRAAARDGLGLACLARYLGDPEERLMAVPPPSAAPPLPVRELWLGVHDDMRHTPRIRAFGDALQQGLRGAAGRLNPA